LAGWPRPTAARPQEQARALLADLESETAERIFDEGLHEYLTRFITGTAGAGRGDPRYLSERGDALMRLSVDHVTRYRFDRPVRGAVQSHRLTPSESTASGFWTGRSR
jgi:hypothetical protein